MSVFGSVPTPHAGGTPEAAANVRDLATWRESHELRALRDTIALYRDCAADLAMRNAQLQEELDDLVARLQPVAVGRLGTRTRGACRR